MKSKHTPGQFRYAVEGYWKPAILREDGFVIAYLQYAEPGDGPLFAAAPDLLEALEGLVRWRYNNGSKEWESRLYAQARAAIEKAKNG